MYSICHQLKSGNWRVVDVPDNWQGPPDEKSWSEDELYPSDGNARIFPTEAEARAEVERRNAARDSN